MRKPIIIGNWKLNKTIAEAVSFIEAIEPLVHNQADFGFAAPYLALEKSVKAAKHLIIASENVAFAESGAYTGEVSVAMLQEIGVKWTLIGHSERRQYFGESDETVNKKVLLSVKNGLTPIVCVGETLAQFEAGDTEKIVRTQTAAALNGLSGEDVAKLVIAYEPVWAIGTGKTASPQEAQQVHAVLRAQLHAATEQADRMLILYGGSMNAANAAQLLSQTDIDGGLVGGASLKAADFLSIIAAAH